MKKLIKIITHPLILTTIGSFILSGCIAACLFVAILNLNV